MKLCVFKDRPPQLLVKDVKKVSYSITSVGLGADPGLLAVSPYR